MELGRLWEPGLGADCWHARLGLTINHATMPPAMPAHACPWAAPWGTLYLPSSCAPLLPAQACLVPHALPPYPLPTPFFPRLTAALLFYLFFPFLPCLLAFLPCAAVRFGLGFLGNKSDLVSFHFPPFFPSCFLIPWEQFLPCFSVVRHLGFPCQPCHNTWNTMPRHLMLHLNMP